MSGIGVILNPHSRSNRRNPERLKRLAFIVGDKGSCHTTQDVLDVEKICNNFAERELEIVCISGGDGTIHHTITTLIKTYGDRPLPKITLLRGGTINNVSNAVGMKGTPESILSRLILKYHEDEEIETQVIHCLDVNGSYGFLFGNILISNFIEKYIKRGEGGAYNALMLAARCGCSALFNTDYMLKMTRRVDARITVDGKVWPFKNYSVINAGTVEPFGFGVYPFPRAREKEDHFQMVAYTMTPRKILGTLFRLLAKRSMDMENTMDDLAKTVEVEMDESNSYMIDGELYPPTNKITIKCGPKLNIVKV